MIALAAEPERVRHPVFARFYVALSKNAERAGQAEHRDRLLRGLSGRVIELGAGHGLNFEHYPTSVTEVLAVEPEPHLRRQAEVETRRVAARIRVVDGTANALPAETGSFDAGVTSLVLCSVPDQLAALAELHRVIRPGGELRFYEHVLAPAPALARLQRLAQRTGFWPLVGGGCHPARRTEQAIAAAGFEIQSCERFSFRPTLVELVVEPRILGSARRPA